MDMLRGGQITAADLTDWRKLGQGLHTRFLVGDISAGVRLLTAIGEAVDTAGHLEARLGTGYLDLKLMSGDAIYRDEEGGEHHVDWTTEHDLDLARRISHVAAERSIPADPRSVTVIELELNTANGSVIAPVWSVLLTGGTIAQGRGTISDDVRDATNRVPIVSFGEGDPTPTPPRGLHVDLQVPYDVAEERIAAAVAAGATVVDDSQAPWTTILADPDGNTFGVNTFQPAPGLR